VAVPWLAWLALVAWGRRPRGASGGRERRAVEIVAGARRELEGRGSDAAPAAARAVERALETRYGTSLAGLSPRERKVRLERSGAGVEVVESAEAARAALEGIRFGGVGTDLAARELARLGTALRTESGVAPRAVFPGLVALGLGLAFGLGLALALAWPSVVDGAQASVVSPQSGPPAATAWGEANQSYRAGDLATAVRGYEALSASYDDPRLEADLAAALWREGRRGEALARYRSALALAPRNGAMRSDERRLWNELGRPPQNGPLERVLGLVRLDELLAALLAASWLTAGAVAASRVRSFARPVARGAIAAIVALALAAALHAWTIERPERAVATDGAELRASPGGEPIASLPEGAVVRVLERGAEGWRVRSADLPAGWVAPDRIVPLH
jgi:tetratricopeptide (TPR) repeat protein